MSRATVALLLALVSSTALAQPPDNALEFGLGIGQASLKGTATFTGTLAPLSGTERVNQFGLTASAGWRFNRFISAEAAYIDTPRDFVGTFHGLFDLTAHPHIAEASALPMLPLAGGNVALFARLGMAHYWSNFNAGGVKFSGSGNEFVWGGGLQFFVEGALLRLEYQQFKTTQSLDLLPVAVVPLDLQHRLISMSVVWLL